MHWLIVAKNAAILVGALGAALFGIFRGLMAATKMTRAYRRHGSTGKWAWDSAVGTRQAQLDELRAIRNHLRNIDHDTRE